MIVDLFAGPGGWDVAAHELGLDPIGIEYEQWACATRAAAGFQTIRADVATVDPARFAGLDGLIASPPCQGFSMAGKGAARDLIPELLASIRARRWDDRADPDPRVWLIVDMGRWLEQLDPAWIALEQVPGVMPIWRAYADLFRDRRLQRLVRAVERRRLRCPTDPHEGDPDGRPWQGGASTGADHAREPVDSLFGTQERWVTMAEALGWGMTNRPGMTLAVGTKSGGIDPMGLGGSGARRIVFGERGVGRWVEPGEIDGDWRVGFPRRDDKGTSPDGYRERDWSGIDEPAPTLTGRSLLGLVVEPLEDDEPQEYRYEDDELAWGVLGDDWVVSTGMNTMSVSRDPQDMQPYERPISEPAPTLGTMAGGQWSVGPPGHRQPPMRWKDDVTVEMRRGGDRIHEGVDPGEEPSPTVTTRADRWQVNTGRAWAEGGSREDAQVVDASNEPAPALTAKSGGQWQIRNTGRERATVRDGDEPAPTLAFGHTSSEWVFERPATTIQGDARVFTGRAHRQRRPRQLEDGRPVGERDPPVDRGRPDPAIVQPRLPCPGHQNPPV